MAFVDLIYHSGFPWHSKGDCHVKGFAHAADGRFLEGDNLLDYFKASTDFADLRNRLALANGMYSVIISDEGRAWLGVDRMRTFPLFYGTLSGKGTGRARIMITDSVDRIIGREGDWHMNRSAADEFLATGYVTGRETLARNIYQVPAGELVEIMEGEKDTSGEPAGSGIPGTALPGIRLNRAIHSSYRTAQVRNESEKELEGELGRVTERVSRRLVESLRGRPVCIALSGGYDSRFVASMLKKMDYPDVCCFSYGREGNPDMLRAGEVAGRLGYPFIPVVYTDALIGQYLGEGDFYDYVRYSSNYTSMFFLQEYFALKDLQGGGKIPADAVFIPGHSGDFFGGSQLVKHGLHGGTEDIRATVRRIYQVKYAWFRQGGTARKTLFERIKRSILEKGAVEDVLPYSIHEDWDLKEKLAKFIVNSCNIYGWFGYEYRLPLYDYELQDFFRDLPFELKAGKRLYDGFLRRRVFGDLGLNFPRELQPDLKTQQRMRLKRKLRKILPETLVPATVSKHDPIFYHEITGILRKDLADKGIKIRIRGNSYNSLIVQWYIEYLKGIRDAGDRERRPADD